MKADRIIARHCPNSYLWLFYSFTREYARVPVDMDDMLCGICYTDNSGYIISHKLEYMSAPPQANAGGEEGSAYTTITAPWIPQLKVGDRLEIPQRVYMRFFATVGAGKATQFIQVTTMSIHFGTTGGVNSMTVQGFNVK